MQQPVAALHIAEAARGVGLVARAGEPLSVLQHGGEAELLGLGGQDVKEGHIIVQNVRFPRPPRAPGRFGRRPSYKISLDRQAAERLDRLHQVRVAVNL